MNLWLLCWLPSLLYVLAACCRLAITARRNRCRPSVAAPPEPELLCEICGLPYLVAAYVSSPNPIRLCAACVAEDAGFCVREGSEH